MTEDYYVMWLSGINGLKRKQIFSLIDTLGSAECVWNANRQKLISANIINEETADKIIENRDEYKLEELIFRLEENEIRYISFYNEEYPKLLAEIIDPPLGFYIKGEMPDKRFEKVAVVGSRRCSNYGSMVAEKLSKDMAKRNIVVVSGMARGIDSKAHIGAIEGGSQTIAVLGCGIDVCYPPENQGLMDRIIKNGCVISEFHLETPPLGTYFPQRNRIISGLCKCTIVVEAEKRSGTLITVHQALDNGRTVFAVPGNITSETSKGTNELIKDGAPIVTSAEDIFTELGIADNDEIKSEYINKVSEKLENDEKKVYDCINMEPIDIATLSQTIDNSLQDIQYILTMLELKGFIRKLPGEKYIKSL